MIIPQDICDIIVQKMDERASPAYYRVVMTLGQVLETKFLTRYIKLGASMWLLLCLNSSHLLLRVSMLICFREYHDAVGR